MISKYRKAFNAQFSQDTYDALSFSAFNALETLVLTFLKSF